MRISLALGRPWGVPRARLVTVVPRNFLATPGLMRMMRARIISISCTPRNKALVGLLQEAQL